MNKMNINFERDMANKQQEFEDKLAKMSSLNDDERRKFIKVGVGVRYLEGERTV